MSLAACCKLVDVNKDRTAGQESPTLRLSGALVFAVALVLRLVYLFQVRDNPFFDNLIVDSGRYDEWARQVAAGNWLGSGVFYQAPLYPYALGALYTIAGPNLVVARLAHAVLGALACVLCGRAAARLFDHWTGLVAGMMLATYAPAIFFDGVIQKATFDLLFMSIGLVAVAACVTAPSLPRWLGLGLAFGFFSLTRENMLVAGLLLTAWPFFHSGVGTYGRRAAAAFLVLAGVAAPLLPVYARNVSFGARTSITTYQLGSNFYIGNHTGATGSYKPLLPTRGDTRFEEADARGIAERESGRPLTADGVSAFWLGKTFREIAADPMGWLNLMLRKCALAVNRIEKIDTDDIYFMEQHSLLLRLLNSFWNFGLLFPLAIAGMVAARSKWRELLIPILLLGVTMGSMIAFYVVARYRHGAAPILVLFAAVAAVRGFRAIHAERFGDLRLPVLGAATAGLLAWWPVTSKENQLATSYFNAAGILYKQGDPAGAAAFYRRALKSGFSEPSANVNLAVSLIGTGELSEARELLEAVLPNAPDKATVALNLGNIALREDRTSDALRLYSSARDMDSSSPEIANALGVALWRSGMSAEAQEMFDAAIALKPGYPAPYRNLASMSTAAGRNTEAIAILERGMKLAEEPATAEALRNLSIELRQHAVPSGTAATTATP